LRAISDLPELPLPLWSAVEPQVFDTPAVVHAVDHPRQVFHLILNPMDRRIGGKLIKHVFRGILPRTRNRHATNEEVMEAVQAGDFSFLFDENGKFIED
jgi:hypothetical protein